MRQLNAILFTAREAGVRIAFKNRDVRLWSVPINYVDEACHDLL